jgi:PAS domain S-box-containing protein
LSEDKSPICVLLIEPNESSRQLIRDLFLENMPGHYELHLAPSYSAALSMAQHRSYDVCFAPLRIGERDVTEVLSEMSGNKPEIPVIILTSGAGPGTHDVPTAGPKDDGSPAMERFCGNFLEQHIRYAMERSRVESALMKAKKKWEHIFDAVPDPLAIIDLDYRFDRVNRAMAGRLGAKPEDLVGRACYEVVHCLTLPADFCPLSLMFKDGLQHSAEIFEKNMNGTFLVSVSPLYDDENHLTGGIHVARDITHLKDIEAALRESNEKLEQHVAMRTVELVQKAEDLKESNIAMKVLMKHREQDRTEIQESVTHNIRELVFPNLDRMEHGIASKEQLNACIREIKNCLENVISPSPRSLSGKGLSPAELRIAEMIRAGKSTKEIADLLSISHGTVRTHRERIRKKLGLTNQKTNLQTYLHSLH